MLVVEVLSWSTRCKSQMCINTSCLGLFLSIRSTHLPSQICNLVYGLKVLRNLIISHPQFDFFSPPTLTIPNFEILDFSFQPPWVSSVSLGQAGLVAVAVTLLA